MRLDPALEPFLLGDAWPLDEAGAPDGVEDLEKRPTGRQKMPDRCQRAAIGFIADRQKVVAVEDRNAVLDGVDGVDQRLLRPLTLLSANLVQGWPAPSCVAWRDVEIGDDLAARADGAALAERAGPISELSLLPRLGARSMTCGMG